MTGPAGAGKCELVFFFFLLVELVHCSDILSSAKLLEALLLYARKFSKNIGHEFTKNTIRVTAVTGAAATKIGGQTTCKELHLAKKGHMQLMKRCKHFWTPDFASLTKSPWEASKIFWSL